MFDDLMRPETELAHSLAGMTDKFLSTVLSDKLDMLKNDSYLLTPNNDSDYDNGNWSTNSSVSVDKIEENSAAYFARVLPSVIAMAILFALSAVGNVTVFSTLVTSPLRKTRISTIILHLTIADLIVTFLVIPSEVRIRLNSAVAVAWV